MRMMLRMSVVVCLLSVALVTEDKRVTRMRAEINIPNVPGYVTLKCDFHMHTVFSDGLVWPTVRVEEAWREGLDAIAFTDHIESSPHAKDLICSNLNRSADIARSTGTELDIIVIRGSEITRTMPPGHLNAIFLTNATALALTEWRDAVTEAHGQGAFIFWNHPGWKKQLTNDVVRWYPEHTELLEQKLLGGIEVANGRSYYPDAHRWALEKKLTMMSNSDIHAPLNLDYQLGAGEHRPMTLVFAKERTADAIKEALLARRTAVYSADSLVGEKQFLKPIFDKSIQIKKPQFAIKGLQRVMVQIANNSDIEYKLRRDGDVAELNVPKDLTLPARRTALWDVRGTGVGKGKQTVELPFKVANLLVAPDEPLRVTLKLQVDFVK